MKTNLLLVIAVCGGMLLTAGHANAQEEVVVVQEDVTVTESIPCKNHYYAAPRDNWFIQLGAGINSPFVENKSADGDAKHQITAAYNVGFGKWFSPYLAWRLSFTYTNLHWQNWDYNKAKSINANFDLMWDMFNSLGGVNTGRTFSIIPFVGIGGTYNWDFRGHHGNVMTKHGTRHNQWTLPVSAGLQLRFRLCKYADFFMEGRASFHGDNFNNYAFGGPIDIDMAAIGGFSFNIGGAGFHTYNPCNDAAYIAGLNNQINNLRGELADCVAAQAATAAALADCLNQEPAADCPEVNEQPLMSTVRFTLNSDRITDEEMVNIYNTAEWMKAHPDANVTIKGYADKDTGTSAYNMELSKRRAQAVYDALTKAYGISADRLTVDSFGSDTQPYRTNNWNRIVIFAPGK